jgi:tRNA(Leu) C34 or U34 (ribose-2'-O)-methylase TrmL
MRGFSSIGLVSPKNNENVGGVMRAAYNFDVAMVAIQGDRTTSCTSRLDTLRGFRHLPVLRNEDLMSLCPYEAAPVAVDRVEDAQSLITFQHPKSAFYIFGPEDGTIPDEIMEQCPIKVMIPTRHCMNLATCVNVVLYDRMMKADRFARGQRWFRPEDSAA